MKKLVTIVAAKDDNEARNLRTQDSACRGASTSEDAVEHRRRVRAGLPSPSSQGTASGKVNVPWQNSGLIWH
jgi:hypothetical protein